MLLVLVVVLAVILFILVYKDRAALNTVPGPSGLSIIGNFYNIEEDQYGKYILFILLHK